MIPRVVSSDRSPSEEEVEVAELVDLAVDATVEGRGSYVCWEDVIVASNSVAGCKALVEAFVPREVGVEVSASALAEVGEVVMPDALEEVDLLLK